MSAGAQFAVGERIQRLNDNAPGVVRDMSPKGHVWVVWDSSGLETIVLPLEIRRV